MADQDYSKLTVKELKALIKERNVFSINCTKKIDYVKALEDDDKFISGMSHLTSYAENVTKGITETREKIVDTAKKYDDKINELKQKEGKTTEDYEKLVMLLENRIKLASVSI